ncbi:LNS2-domain-containing protein [Hypoxylon trugodes]|uniref:LNS2-domain-containing protein n=1 Tax=Hypoxylon trugodes TaxID=326681 RepID=UPI00218FB69A|nr:LNS2-domain-containing protein [Hypoxylon trugodes]KAI1383856.1 LNS2-domain-containing protein [Hypoxylon trugodes]
MQYVRNISDSVSTAWNSINPATLSGAIDVIVVQHEDGSLCCSPFHVRFGKFSLLRPYEKKVEFRVNGAKQDYAMKLGEGGEAFFVFETNDTIPQSLQTSPLSSPASSPPLGPDSSYSSGALQEPDFLQLDSDPRPRSMSTLRPKPAVLSSQTSRPGIVEPIASSPELGGGRPTSKEWSNSPTQQSYTDDILPAAAQMYPEPDDSNGDSPEPDSPISQRPRSPPPLAPREAIQRAMTLSKELSAVNIPSRVTETGDLMLDMTGYKSSEEDAIKAEILARNILSEELQGDYDIGALFGMDEEGNLWIYSSEDAKEAAMKKTVASLRPSPTVAIDAASDPGYQSDDSTTSTQAPSHRRSESDVGQISIQTPPTTPGSSSAGNPNRNYAKTLRLTSDQLKALNLKPGENSMSFTVNRATCQAYMYLWQHDTPVVISDIDGTITKSDALGHVLNMIGRDWTHTGVAKLYSDIVENGYNIMYLTSRSVGQADTTRAYLYGITQDGYRLPRGPTILSPDRTMAALRREIYLRKPHVFKMATLRDIRSLYGPDNHCFYAGFGNRLTDQISYRTVDVPRNRIFTINSNAEVSLDLLSLNKLKLSYVNMTEVVNHYFPPVSTLVKGGGVEYTDFTYWRDTPLELDEFSASESDEGVEGSSAGEEEEEDEDVGNMGDSFLSRGDEEEEDDVDAGESILSGEYEGEENMIGSMIDDGSDDADDEGDLEEDDQIEYNNNPRQAPHNPRAQGEPAAAVRDVDAELITGMSNLGLDKDTKETKA